MSRLSSSSERIVIVGGGFAGLSAAARLAQAGLPVTVLEASQLGAAASTRNQGWLHSGAWFAPSHPQLARQCYESLQQTIAFCPECIEIGQNSMVYFGLKNRSGQQAWKTAWEQAGIPCQTLLTGDLNWDFPGMGRESIAWAFRLPDRSFRPDVLLSRLARAARDAGAEIRAETLVAGLLVEDRRVHGVAVGANEEVRARLVILATGAYSQQRFSHLFQPIAGRQSDYQLVCLKTHLRAVQPGLTADPFCLVDGDGFNHLPHDRTSVFGTSRWNIVFDAEGNAVDEDELAIIEGYCRQLFPTGFGEDVRTTDWAGTTVQAMHAEQIEPGAVPLPSIVDHAREPCAVENVLSIFPGRATLWASLAEQVRMSVLDRLGHRPTQTSRPPWAVTT